MIIFNQISKNHRYQKDTVLLHPVERLTSVHADFVKIHVLDVSSSDQNRYDSPFTFQCPFV
jgi:hypothetical protein